MATHLSWDVESDLYGSTVHAFKKKKKKDWRKQKNKHLRLH